MRLFTSQLAIATRFKGFRCAVIAVDYMKKVKKAYALGCLNEKMVVAIDNVLEAKMVEAACSMCVHL